MRKFYFNTALVSLGALGAQIIAFVSYPVLTRLYGPEPLGNFASFFLAVQFLAMTIGLRYEQAITIAPSRGVLEGVISVVITLSSLICVFITLGGYIFGDYLDETFSTHIGSMWSLIGIAGLLAHSQLLGIFLLGRRGKYLAVTFAKLAKATMSGGMPLLLACIGPVSVIFLIIGELAGSAIAVVILGFALSRGVRPWLYSARDKGSLIKRAIRAAERYQAFPKLNLPHVFQNSAAPFVIILVITSQYGVETAGLFFMMQRICSAPAALVSSSLSLVYFRAAVVERKANGLFRRSFLMVLLPTAAVAIPVFGAVALYGGSLFAALLGKGWEQAGALAQVYAPFSAVHLVMAALGHTNVIANKQAQMLWVGAGQTLLFVGSFAIGASLALEIEESTFLAVCLTTPYLLGVGIWYWSLAFGRELKLHAAQSLRENL